MNPLDAKLLVDRGRFPLYETRRAVVPFIMEINFSSKFYSKSLLKIGSLKGLVVYSLILNYQFCACVMRISGVPQLQVIHMERLYGYK